MVAERLCPQSNENRRLIFLQLVLVFLHAERSHTARSPTWFDRHWSPRRLLTEHGFQILLEATNVRAVQEEADGALTFVIQEPQGEYGMRFEDGEHQLQALIRSVQNAFLSSAHWATVTDVALLSSCTEIGFIVFTNKKQQGLPDRGWSFSLNLDEPKEVANYKSWILLYNSNYTHFQPMTVNAHSNEQYDGPMFSRHQVDVGPGFDH